MSTTSSGLEGWRLPLRLARRDALRHRARSVLVLVMIALPVLAVTTADVLIQTQHVNGPESVDRRIGSAQALVSVTDGVTKVDQRPDPNDGFPATTGDGKTPAPTADQVRALLDGAPLVELRLAEAALTTDKGVAQVDAVETDLQDPLTDGLVTLRSGRLPRTDHEVVVNQALLDKGYAVGDQLRLAGDSAPAAPTIVGVADSTTVRGYPFAAGPVGSLGLDTQGNTEWLAGGGPVSWDTVRRLNGIGATVTSRAVIDDPPPPSRWPSDVRSDGSDHTNLAVLGLIAMMALIEVVLLAGPAFAVTARKQQRSLALMAATGGTPAQSRRVIIASAAVLGGVAAVAGVVLGIGAAKLLQPLLQDRSNIWFGPFDVPSSHLLGIGAFGLLSAFLAAVVPAYLASKQDVVAVLAGRRADRPPSLRSPVLGVVLLAVGILGSAAGASGTRLLGTGELLIAFSAIPAVLGMVLLVPVALAGVARLSSRLPLTLRYAVRDANRHRTRTVPAVSAVAATVAGVVALGIGLTSSETENRDTYLPTVAAGVGIVDAYTADPPWPAFRAVIARELPGATVTAMQGLPDYDSTTTIKSSAGPDNASFGAAVGAQVMVSPDRLPLGLIGLTHDETERATTMLRRGGVVVFGSDAGEADGTQVKLVHQVFDPTTGENRGPATRTSAPAAFIDVDDRWRGPAAVIAPKVAQELGVSPTTVSLAVTGVHVTTKQQDDIDEGLAAAGGDVGLYVERGYQPDQNTQIVELVLILLGAVLMLGGTLTATFLALSDARPDLATLSAVGASPRTRRGIAAAYAVVVGTVGALMGAVVGFIPGIAVTRPLTEGTGPDGGTVGPYLDVPWLTVLALVVVLPAATALVVGLFARSRLPLVARLD